jgi:hypothetical protein
MALPAHVVHAAAGLPLDEATRPELIPFGQKLTRGENIRQPQRGAVVKRDGFTSLANARADGTTPTATYKHFADRNSIVRVTDALQAEAYSFKAQAWASLGRMPEATARIIDLPSMGITTYLEDVDATNGYIAIGWLSLSTASATSAFLAIIDQATGSVVRAPEKVGAPNVLYAPLLAVQGNYFIMAQCDGVSDIDAWYLDTTSAATIANGWVAFGAALATDTAGVAGGFALHSLPHATTPRVAMLYINTSGGTNQLTLKTFNVAGVVQTRTFLTNSLLPTACALGGFATDTLWLTWNELIGVNVAGVEPFTIATDKATVIAPITLTTGCDYLGIAASTTAGKARIWANDSSVASKSHMRGVQTVLGAAAADGVQMTVPAVKLVRKPMFLSGRYYGAFYNEETAGNPQNNFFVCDWTADVNFIRPVANPAPGLASVGLTGQGKFIAGTTATTFFVGFGIKRSAIADGSALLQLDFADGKRWQTAAHGNSTALAAAVPSYFDGARVAEIGFLCRPAIPTTTRGGTGITATLGGYRYIAVYEETDADGNWHVSGLSAPSAATGNFVDDTVTVSTTPLAISSRLASAGASYRGVRVAWYRTADGGSPPYYRLGTTVNDPSALAVTYADALVDGTDATALAPATGLRAQSKLYSQTSFVLGSAQDRRPPPFLSCVVSYNGMLVGASGSDVWSSGQDVIGEGTWFNPIWQIPIPGDGDITALAVLDGTLVVFKRREVYAIAGEPPADNGTSGGLGSPRRLASDVGCIDSRTTCTTALGVFFQSERGIEILTRAQSVEWIGEPFVTTLAAFPVCTSITVEPVSNTVLVELAAGESAGLVTGSGRTLVYDLSLKCWVSKDIRTASEVLGVPSQSACMVFTGTAWRYAWSAPTGLTHHETPGTSLDGASWITALIEMANCKHGLQQEQRVWGGVVLFERLSAAGLKIEIAYNYGAYSAANDKVWSEATTLTARQLPFRPKPEPGTAMRFRISDTAPAVLGTGKGFALIGVSLDTAPKQGSTTGTSRLDNALVR